MSLLITFNGSTFIIPEPGEVGWGSNLDAYFVAIAAGALQKTGGTFTLSADADFGASFGLRSLYYKSRSSNIAGSGILRMNNNDDFISWRNAANTLNLNLFVNASDQLVFNGSPISGSGLYTASRAIISDGAGNLTAATTTSTEIGYVNGVTSAIQTQLNAKADDSLVVHLAGTETITGIKNFTANPTLTTGSATFRVQGTTNTASGIVYALNDLSNGVEVISFGSTNGSSINGRAVANLGAIASDKSLFIYTASAASFISLGINAAEQIYVDSTGVTLTNPLSVASGGTGAGTHTAYALLTGGTTSTGTIQSLAGVGSSGQVLTSNGAGVLPTFQNATGTGTVSSGTAGRLTLYNASTNAVTDTYVQNSNNINIAIASHATLAATRTYTIPDAGASASFLMTQGSQTVVGQTSFSTSILGWAGTGATQIAYSFTGDTNSGLAWLAGDDIALVVNGSAYLEVTTSTLTANTALAMTNHKITGLANGTAATDAVAFGQQYVAFQAPVHFSTTTDTSNSTTTFASTNLTASFTLTNSAHRVAIWASGQSRNNTAGGQNIFALFKDTTNLDDATNGQMAHKVTTSQDTAGVTLLGMASPGDTSSHSYTVYFKTNGTGTGHFIDGATAHIILMEVV